MAGKADQPGSATGGTARGTTDPLTGSPPEAALGAWLSWLKGHMGGLPGQGTAGDLLSAWMLPSGAAAGSQATAGLDQLKDMLDRDPLLGSIDRAWNANPLNEVIPVDWAEVVRALRTVWLRRMADPGRVPCRRWPR